MRMPVTGGVDAEQVRVAAGSVVEPEAGLPLADLGLVGEVSVHAGGRVRVRIGLLAREHPSAEPLRAAGRSAVGRIDGVRRVSVDFAPLPERARAELGDRLRSTSPPVGRTPRIYAVASGKGGVGKSTVAANLAAALAAGGQRVGLVDADVWGYSVPQLFGVRRNPTAIGGLMLPVPAHGVRLMSVGFFVDDEQPVMWRGPMLHKALEQFVTDVRWGELDVFLLDLPPGTGDITLSLLELVPDAALIAVTTPQLAARSVASRVLRLARETGMPLAGVIENMSTAVCAHCGEGTSLFGSGGGAALAEQAGTDLLGQVPLDLALRLAGDEGVPAVVRAPDTPSAGALTRIAAGLPTVRRGLLGRSLPLTVL
jgi:ATP-binding protein involved in chromosome partitioning